MSALSHVAVVRLCYDCAQTAVQPVHRHALRIVRRSLPSIASLLCIAAQQIFHLSVYVFLIHLNREASAQPSDQHTCRTIVSNH